MDNITGINYDASENDLKSKLDSALGYDNYNDFRDDIKVKRTGTCMNYKWCVEWLKRPGDLPAMTMV